MVLKCWFKFAHLELLGCIKCAFLCTLYNDVKFDFLPHTHDLRFHYRNSVSALLNNQS